jgi:hypothetical protein
MENIGTDDAKFQQTNTKYHYNSINGSESNLQWIVLNHPTWQSFRYQL